MPDFLNVSASLTGRRWLGPPPEQDRLADALSQQAGLPPALARILAARGILPEQAEAHLAPTLRDLLPDPLTLKDMGIAAERFLTAIKRRERIAVFSDYDVDGGTSAALVLTYLRELGQKATLYIPDRIDEGYGPNEPAMAALARDHGLILCLDCGTLSHGPIAAARDADVLVLDHHLGGETLPPALAVVNPNRQDEEGSLGHLCAAAVTFLLLVEVNRRLRLEGQRGPDLMAMLDLVALATVADVAPLIGVNRAFVRQGLTIMARRERPGLVALADVARLDVPPAAYHLGFVLGPRVNAGGRIGEASLGARLLSTDNRLEAENLAARLDALNSERREIEARVREEAIAQAESRGLEQPLAWAAGDGWHPGVVGIVAARLKEAANRPSVVIGFDGEIGKGSGRSVDGIDLGASIHRLAEEGLIEKGGGHKMAAGLTLTRAQLVPAMERLAELLARQGADRIGPADLRLDGLLMPGAASVELIERIEQAGPFGQAAPAPRFAFPAQMIRNVRRIGENHLRLQITDSTGPSLSAVAFSCMDGPLGQALYDSNGARFHVAGRLEINHWQGRQTPQLRIEDAARA